MIFNKSYLPIPKDMIQTAELLLKPNSDCSSSICYFLNFFNLSTGRGIENKTLRKIKFLCVLLFNAELITYHTCEFQRNILKENKTMAVRIQKCTYEVNND